MSNKTETKTAGIGAIDFFCMGFGSIVGVGWALSINKWMLNSGGPLPASLGYLLALIMMVPVALCYCELAPMMPVAGGGMAYAYRAFNDKVSFLSGWCAFGAFVTIIPWEAIYICNILSVLFPAIKGNVLYTLVGEEVYLGQIVIGTLFTLLLFAINWKGATTSALMQRILTFILVGSGILAMIMGLATLNTANFLPAYQNLTGAFHNSFLFGAFTILATAPFFLGGFETIPQAVEDSGAEATVVGKTVVLAVASACVFYALLLFTLGGAMPWTQFVPTNQTDETGSAVNYGKPDDSGLHIMGQLYLQDGRILTDPAAIEAGLADGSVAQLLDPTMLNSDSTGITGGVASPGAANLYRITFYGSGLGDVLYYIILIGGICGLLTTWNGFLMASPRLMMGMARGYMLPKALAKQNDRGIPTTSLLCCTVLSLAGPFLGMGLIDPLTLFSAAGFVTSWMVTAFCVVKLRKSEPEAERPYRLPGGSAMAWFGGIVMAAVLVCLFIPATPLYMGGLAIKVMIGWLVFGLILYIAAGVDRGKVTPEERSASLFEVRKNNS
jgi:amino acid transporter